MVLGSKSEDRIKQLLQECYTERKELIDKQIIDSSTGLLLWGFTCGIIVAYTGFWPFLIGCVIGYSAAQAEIPIIKQAYIYGCNIINSGYVQIRGSLHQQEE